MNPTRQLVNKSEVHFPHLELKRFRLAPAACTIACLGKARSYKRSKDYRDVGGGKVSEQCSSMS